MGAKGASFEHDRRVIRWRLHLRAPPETVHRFLATADGRARFWAESAEESDEYIVLQFPNGQILRSRIVENVPPRRFGIVYFNGSEVMFDLTDDGTGGTDLTLTEAGVPEANRIEQTAGWVSVLLALKAAVDFHVDLRNHDPRRTWDQGYVDP